MVVLCLLSFLVVGGCRDDSDNDTDQPTDDMVPKLASYGMAFSLQALLKGADIPLAEIIGKNVAGIIMALIFQGGEDPNQEILEDLEDIKKTLDDIELQLGQLADQLRGLKIELAIDTSEIEQTIVANGLNPYVVQINSLWNQFNALHDPKDNSWVTDDTRLMELSLDILDSLDGVFRQLVGIHDGLTGEGGVSASILQAVAKTAALKTNAGGDPLRHYYLIESYFGTMLQAQNRAATLMVEALRYREGKQESFGGYPQDAEFFMQWFNKHVEDQVEHFLNATEYFVTMTANPEKGFTEFVPDADTILKRADLTAAWLSSRHRPSPDDPDGQNIVVYRVIGGPARVSTYPATWHNDNWNANWNRMQYEITGLDPTYDVPEYDLTVQHDWAELKASPYVQFLPGSRSGDPKALGSISDATVIAVSKYYSSDFTVPRYVAIDFYLEDFCCRNFDSTWISAFNSAGDAPADDEPSILYGHVLDIQHPPALMMGNWYTRHSHNSTKDLNGSKSNIQTDGVAPRSWSRDAPWAYLSIDAWPTWDEDLINPGAGWVKGSFYQEFADEGHYWWAGSDDITLKASYTASIDHTLYKESAPGNHWWGLYFWMERDDQTDEKSHGMDYKSGSTNVNGSTAVTMAQNTPFYVSAGSRMTADWKGKYVDYDDWHHWEADLTIQLTDLSFTIE